MKKVGVVTLFGLTNYGNRLQNYALVTKLRSLGFSSFTLIDVRKFFFFKMDIKSIIIKFIKLLCTNERKRYDLFWRFQRRIKTKNIHTTNCESIDFYICGSDQIWKKLDGRDMMFLRFAQKSKRIAYSASFGVTSLPKNDTIIYKKYLSEMKAISVREEAGSKIVKELINQDVPVLIDPTLMLEKSEWMRISAKPTFNVKSKYILTYFLGTVSDERNKYIKTIAEENNYEIIRLELYNHTDAWYKTGPSEFIWLIEHCSMMFTDSFHGSVFSILFDVPFIIFDREDMYEDMSSRLDSLISKFHLENRRFNSQSSDEIRNKDFSEVRSILEVERKKSVDFLKSALSD